MPQCILDSMLAWGKMLMVTPMFFGSAKQVELVGLR